MQYLITKISVGLGAKLPWGYFWKGWEVDVCLGVVFILEISQDNI